MTLEHLTLRLSPDIFRAISHMFGAAQARLDHASETVVPPANAVAGTGGPHLH